VKVALCGASEDHQHCVEDWRNGVLIFTDTNGSAMITSPEQILYVIANSNHFGILHWRSSFKVNYLQIQPEGSTNGENGTFWYCPHHARAPSWALIVSLAGRARVALDETDLKKLLCA
jgi:type IV fimbrial biogenesis protein FimT